MNRISSASFIIKGLEYHYSNYIQLDRRYRLLKQENNDISYFAANCLPLIEMMKHEVVAYINRLGQFYYFTISEQNKEILDNPKSFIPKITYFMPFRNKYSAHRAVDVLKPNDQIEYMRQLDMSFSFVSTFKGNRLVFHLFLDQTKDDIREFDICSEHDHIISETSKIMLILNTALESDLNP